MNKQHQLIRIANIVWLLFVFPAILLGQSYEVDCDQKPLNKVLIELRQDFGLQFSYNERLIAEYSVSVSGSFLSASELIDEILAGLPLNWELMGGVFVIFPEKERGRQKEFLVSGQILEKGSGEPLPSSHVLINGFATITNLRGGFSFVSPSDSVFHIKASHLGCFVMDTVLYPGNNHEITLTPFSYDLPEVVVKENIVERSVQMGEAPGLIKLNTYISGYLPGNGDNAVFNLLRLQPGILAAGEQPNDMIIWGSYEGTSRVKFDGFTIWGLKNFSDNISAVNPFMAKNVEILKGGYDATTDDVIGGMVNITGKTGNKNRPAIQVFVNNQTANGMLETPVSERSSIVLAYRQTYHNGMEAGDIDLSTAGSDQDLQYKIDVKPDYLFRDLNVKYSWQGHNGRMFFWSMMAGMDDFSYTAYQERFQNIIYEENREQNQQAGSSLYWGLDDSSGNHIQLGASWSALNTTYGIRRYIDNQRANIQFQDVDNKYYNDLNELSSTFSYDIKKWQGHQIQTGLEWTYNALELSQDTLDQDVVTMHGNGSNLAGFAQDRISIGNNLEVKPGIRMNHSFYSRTTHFAPRLSVEGRFGEALKFNAAWGLYHQFLVKSSLFDETGNFRYTWSLADGEEIPVMESEHWVAGAAWSHNDFTASVEGYYKTVDGFTRYVRYSQTREEVFTGNGRSYGLDLFLKKDFNGHTFWTSYSLGRAEELFPYFAEQEYRRAPHDQRHELKMTGKTRFFNHFHLSATYVFGTGFPLYANFTSEKYTEPDYNRLDLALVYRLSLPKITGEAGISLLNALDNYNVKYTSFERIPLDQLKTAYIDAEAVDFTPLFFLKLKF